MFRSKARWRLIVAGYRVLERGEHVLASGTPMAATKMRKELV
jgi:hypothetical protein